MLPSFFLSSKMPKFIVSLLMAEELWFFLTTSSTKPLGVLSRRWYHPTTLIPSWKRCPKGFSESFYIFKRDMCVCGYEKTFKYLLIMLFHVSTSTGL